MSIFNQTASKAIAKGATAQQFSQSAQGFANATWTFLLIGGATWYFLGLGWASIPFLIAAFNAFQSVSATKVATKIEAKAQQPNTSDLDIQRIINSYGSFLETSAPAPGVVADEDRLPFEKDQIKEALIKAIRMTPDTTMKGQLKSAYLELSNWQRGVGDKNIGVDLMSMNSGLDDLQAAAKLHVEQSEKYEKWKGKIEEERSHLEEELQGIA